jgi:uncharacterized protein (TIGR02391 family)
MPTDVSEALDAVEGYLAEASGLLEMSCKEGKDRKDRLYTRVEHFVSFAFPDGKARLANFRRSFPIQVFVAGHEQTESEKQQAYVRDLKVMQNNLAAYKDELQLKMSSDKKPDNLGNIKLENSNEKDVAERLFDKLIDHPKIRKASQNHFKNEEYRPAVLDAMISLEVMVKEKAKFPKDNKGKELSGVPLMHKVFDPDNPILSWCKDTRQIDRDELEGYKHIFAGAMQGIRDPKAHAIFQISPMRALKLLTLATLLAELVDASEYLKEIATIDAAKTKEMS